MEDLKPGKPWLLSIADLRKSYRRTYRRLKAAKLRAEKENDFATSITISEMMSDVSYCIEWMMTARRPGNKRGIERRAGYQREKLVDPMLMQSYVQSTHSSSRSGLTDYQRFQIEDALSRLSDQERECYILAHGQCLSHSEIAALLKITKGAVSKVVSRAQQKISEDLRNSLFLL